MLISVESTNQQPIDQPHSPSRPAIDRTIFAACRVDPMPEHRSSSCSRPNDGFFAGSWEVEVDRQGAGKLAVSKPHHHHHPAVAVHHIDIASLLARLYRHRPSAFCQPSHPVCLEPRADLLPRCRRCLQPTPLITTNVSAGCVRRDLFDRQVWLQLPVRRVDCLRCGRVSEHIDWLPSGSPPHPAHAVLDWTLVPVPPIRHVSQLTGVGWHTIKEIDKRRLQTSVGTIELGEVRRLVMDEFALHKGHRYATVIMDAEQTRVLWVGHGNSRTYPSLLRAARRAMPAD